MPDDKPKRTVPDYASLTRSLISEVKGTRFEALRTLEEAKQHADGVIIFEGDYGGAIYLTCPAHLVLCPVEALQQLLLDIDEKFFDYGPSTMVCYERLAAGSGVWGGWGGGLVTDSLWLHPRVEALGLRAPIEAVLSGNRSSLPGIVSDEIMNSRAWCVFRNLVHAVYREARHLGPDRDSEACVTVSSGRLLAPAERCRQARAELESRRLYDLTARARSTTEVLKRYKEETDLSVANLVRVFHLPNWKEGYGGPRWAQIAETLKELASALEAGDIIRATEIAERVSRLECNSGPLVPSRVDWERTPYLREKWPELCE